MSKRNRAKYIIEEFNKPDPVKIAKGRSYIRKWIIENSENPKAMRMAIIEEIRRRP